MLRIAPPWIPACAGMTKGSVMNVLVIDVGGTHVKILATGENVHREFPSGPTLTARQMVARVRSSPKGGATTPCRSATRARCCETGVIAEPHNLGAGWMGFDFEAAFERPVKVINDAAMQALGSYNGGKMLFLGLGTGLGIDDDRRRHRRADGARPPALPEERPTRTTSASAGWSGWARSDGGGTSPTWSSASPPRSCPRTWCSAAATRRSSRAAARLPARATTPMRSRAGFDCGSKRAPRAVRRKRARA